MALNADLRLTSIPPGLRSELEEAAYNHGYRRDMGEANGWLYFASDINVPGEIGLAVAAGGSAWFLAVEHPGVAAELGAPAAAPVPTGKLAAFGFDLQSAMRQALHRTYELSCSLPTLPLHEYLAGTSALGDTEADRVTKQRIGQDVFRRALIRYWDGRCPLTGIREPELLRASHIVPWAECETDAQRLDVHNGLLLSAHWDAAFDAGLVSFAGDGSAIFRPELTVEARSVLQTPDNSKLPLTDLHRVNLQWHRTRSAL